MSEAQVIIQKLDKMAGWMVTTIPRARLAIAKETMVVGAIDIIKEMKSIPTDRKLNVYVEERSTTDRILRIITITIYG
ncbi:MAG: hypothetical protein WA667_22135 [Candidatus Nitrosopolaris sp.]